ncbi:phage minor tail protein L [Paracoccus sp. MKU1]|uniref:phage minor tail protein L n=1 Tax=Paracoccus sp. MKU1 TaxID=1745182 RepID=UPI00071934D8|nr:phage minor tail protein L [Paracoccus sp. MKU1]KRW94361.1 hypothetical protein AQY21_20745 [Paracoccus sp. MKU1]
MSKIVQHARSMKLDARVILFDIDLREKGGAVQRVSPMTNEIGDGRVCTFSSTGAAGIATLPLGQSELTTPGSTALFRFAVRRSASTRLVSLTFKGAGTNQVVVQFSQNTASQQPTTAVTGVTGAVEAASVYAGTDYLIIAVSMPTGAYLQNVIVGFSADGTGARSVSFVKFGAWAENKRARLDMVDLELESLSASHAQATVQVVADEAIYRPILWRGQVYEPRPVEAEGFEITSNGSLPRPTFRMSNVMGEGSLLLKNLGDLSGVEITRWVTFRRFLDDGPNADPNAHYPKEIYVIDQKVSHTRTMIEWQLASAMDQQGIQLPARQVLRTGCQLTYRTFNADTGMFDYTNVSCPYVGNSYFNDKNEPVTEARLDKCSQTQKGCLLRFAGQKRTPFGGFPGAGRISR